MDQESSEARARHLGRGGVRRQLAVRRHQGLAPDETRHVGHLGHVEEHRECASREGDRHEGWDAESTAHRDFMLLFTGKLVSQLGDQVYAFACPGSSSR